MGENFSPAEVGWLVAWCPRGSWSLGVASKLTPEGRVTHARVWRVGLGVPSFFREYPVDLPTAKVASPELLNAPPEQVCKAFLGAADLDALMDFLQRWRIAFTLVSAKSVTATFTGKTTETAAGYINPV